MERVTHILEQYGYPGKKMVGEKYNYVVAIIIEHGGTIEEQEGYLPMLVQQAHKGSFYKNMVRMLVDRIYWKKTKTQIFGSHQGVPFAEAAIVENIKKKYKL